MPRRGYNLPETDSSPTILSLMPSPTLPPNPDPVLNVPMTDELVERHGLLPEEYRHICELLDREPTLTELGVFSVMWSEHCSYKNSRPVLKGFPKEKRDPDSPHQVLVRMQEENAGVVDIGDGWAVCYKIESHNHPSFVEPYEGAATGVGGIVRDIFTMGARPVALTNSLRFGPLSGERARRIMRGVVHGISNYGNCLGIPNVGGDIYFDPCYEGNPLVNALCLGLVKKSEIKRGAAKGLGNPVFYVGAPTGRDGLGGAAFASRELTEDSNEDRPAVQKGDPFMEKLLMEACLEMMSREGLVVGIQDMGAAGLTCSSCETAARGGCGIEIDLNLVPQRETGMNSYEILLSESQERMLVIVAAGREAEMEEIFAKWDLHAAQIGRVTDTRNMVVKQGGVTVADIPAMALTEEAPIYQREAKEAPEIIEARQWQPGGLPDLDLLGAQEALLRMLDEPSLASKAWVWRQYDHTVMAGTTVTPGSDAGVFRVRLDRGKERYLALSNDCNHLYCRANPHRGGQLAIAECLRNLACSGAVPLGMTDNLNFGNPYKPEVFYTVREAVRGLAEACQFFDLPVLGGNVSFYNESPDGAIDPTPVVSVAGFIESRAHVTRQFLETGSEAVLLLGETRNELGASHYLKVLHDLKQGDAPALDLEVEQRLHQFILAQIKAGHVRAAHDLSDGGLLLALVEMLFAPERTFGFRGQLPTVSGVRLDALLFGETQSRVLLSVDAGDANRIEMAAKEAGIPVQLLGHGTEEPHLCLQTPRGELAWEVPALRRTYEQAIPRWMEREDRAGVAAG